MGRVAAADPKATFQELHLSRLNLPYCTGCSACFRKGGAYCPHNDVMGDVLAQLGAADGLIFASTTFNMMPTALAKNFLDPLCYLLHRPRFFTKKALIITSTGGVGAGKAAKYIAGTLKGIGMNRCYRLPVIAFSWNAYQPGGRGLARQHRIADAFQRDVASLKLHPPRFTDLMVYNLFRGMSRAYAPGTAYETEDGVHWLESKQARGVYDPAVPVRNPLKIAFGALFFAFGLPAGRLITATYRK